MKKQNGLILSPTLWITNRSIQPKFLKNDGHFALVNSPTNTYGDTIQLYKFKISSQTYNSIFFGLCEYHPGANLDSMKVYSIAAQNGYLKFPQDEQQTPRNENKITKINNDN
jgi:hypothetical protein